MELKKGETIMTDAALHLPASFLREAFSERSGVPLDVFELYYRGKRLEGEAALASWGVVKGSTIEVKMRGRGGTGESPGSGKSPAAVRGGDADGAGGSDDGGGVKGGVEGQDAGDAAAADGSAATGGEKLEAARAEPQREVVEAVAQAMAAVREMEAKLQQAKVEATAAMAVAVQQHDRLKAKLCD